MHKVSLLGPEELRLPAHNVDHFAGSNDGVDGIGIDVAAKQ